MNSALIATGEATYAGMKLGDLLIGVATLMLAGFTACLAMSTRGSVIAAKKETRTSRLALEAMSKPFVVAMPFYTEDDAADGRNYAERPIEFLHENEGPSLHARFRNIGPGTAIISKLTISFAEHTILVDLGREKILNGNNWVSDRIFPLSNSPLPELSSDDRGSLTIHYSDVAGVKYETDSSVKMLSPTTLECLGYEQRRLIEANAENPASYGR